MKTPGARVRSTCKPLQSCNRTGQLWKIPLTESFPKNIGRQLHKKNCNNVGNCYVRQRKDTCHTSSPCGMRKDKCISARRRDNICFSDKRNDVMYSATSPNNTHEYFLFGQYKDTTDTNDEQYLQLVDMMNLKFLKVFLNELEDQFPNADIHSAAVKLLDELCLTKSESCEQLDSVSEDEPEFDWGKISFPKKKRKKKVKKTLPKQKCECCSKPCEERYDAYKNMIQNMIRKKCCETMLSCLCDRMNIFTERIWNLGSISLRNPTWEYICYKRQANFM